MGRVLPRAPVAAFWLLLFALGRCRGATLVPLSRAACFEAELNEAAFNGFAEDLGVTGMLRSDSNWGTGMESSGGAGRFWKEVKMK